MKYPYILIAMIALLAASCENKKPDAVKPPIPAASAPLPGSPEEVVLKTDILSLTMADYDRCIEVHNLMGRHFSKRALANPQFQRDEVQRCFQIKYLKNYMMQNNITVTPEAHQKALADLEKKYEVQDPIALAQKAGVNPDNIQAVVSESLVPVTVQRYLVTTMSDDEKRKLFDIDERAIAFELADFDNTPSDDDVANYLENNNEDMTRYLKMHEELLNSLPKVEFVRMGYRDDGDHKEALAKLRLMAVQQGMDKAAAECAANADSGCVVINSKEKPLVEERSKSNVWAFRMPEGSVSEIEHSDGFDAFRVTLRLIAPQPLDMQIPAVKERVGREVMKNSVVSPSLIARLKPAIEAADADFRTVTESLGGRFVVIENTYHEMVSQKIVTSHKVLEMVKSIKPEETGLYANPIIDEGRLYVLRATRVRAPSDADFAAHRDEWVERRASDASLATLNTWLRDKTPNMATLNIAPIQEKYGILQPNGTIR